MLASSLLHANRSQERILNDNNLNFNGSDTIFTDNLFLDNNADIFNTKS